MRALVTGAGGFVGNHLIKHLLASGDQVLATYFGGLPPTAECEVQQLDVCDANSCAQIFRRFKPEAIYHLAGIAFVPEAEANFDKVMLINVGGTSNVFRQAHLLELKCSIILISSAEVYGAITPAELPLCETTSVRPANNYSLSKRMAELVAERYDRQGVVNGVIVRPFNHIGAGQDSRFVASNFAEQLARISCGLSDPVIEVGNLSAKRDFSDVRDIVRAYRLCSMGHKGIFNLGSGKSYAIEEILQSLITISGVKVQVKQDASRMRPAEVPEVYGSIEHAKKILKWEPQHTLEQSLQWVYQDALDRVSREKSARLVNG